jgi:superfamily II DNA or RNA helicase
VEHGENIRELAKKIYDYPINYVHGTTIVEIRNSIKNALTDKEILSVICTVASGGVWREGINIPSLNGIINGGGGESELALIQALGRGMRATESKTEFFVVDFLNVSHHYLIKHFGNRMWVYSQMGWI